VLRQRSDDAPGSVIPEPRGIGFLVLTVSFLLSTHESGQVFVNLRVTILQLNALGASALKERIARPGQVSASSTHAPRLLPILANHCLETAAFDAVGASHDGHFRLAVCIQSGHGFVHISRCTNSITTFSE
jgi:hypothetical protein